MVSGRFWFVVLWLGLAWVPSSEATECKLLNLTALYLGGTLQLDSGSCYQLPGDRAPSRQAVKGILIIQAEPNSRDLPQVGFSFQVYSLILEQSASLTFDRVAINDGLLLSGSSSTHHFHLAAVKLNSSSSGLVLKNSLVNVPCQNLASYLERADNGTLPGNFTKTNSSITVYSYSGPSLTITNTTFKCPAVGSPASAVVAVVSVSTATELNEALTALAPMKVASNISLLANISLARPGPVPSPSPWPFPATFSAGPITISPGASVAGAGPMVLDLGMVPELMSLTSGVSVRLVGLVLLNLCADSRDLDTRVGLVTLSQSPVWSMNFRARSLREMQLLDSALLSSEVDLRFQQYWAVQLASPFGAVQSRAQRVLQGSTLELPPPQLLVNNLTERSLSYVQSYSSVAEWLNLTMYLNPPFQLPPNMRTMQVLYCSSGLAVPQDFLLQNQTSSPLFLALDGASLGPGLRSAAEITSPNNSAQGDAYLAPSVLLLRTSLIPSRNNLPPLQIYRDMVISGPFWKSALDGDGYTSTMSVSASTSTAKASLVLPSENGSTAIMGSPTTVMLGLGNQTDILLAPQSAAGQLYMQYLVLGMLARRPLNGTAGGVSSSEPYALPLWALGAYKRAAPSVQLSSVTIALPVGEFQILRQAALLGASWKQVQDPLIQAISVFEQAQAPAANAVHLSRYLGFGVNGTNIVLQPEGLDPLPPRPAGPMRPAPAPTPPPVEPVTSGGGLSDYHRNVIIACTVTIGSVLVLGAVIALLCLHVRRHQQMQLDLLSGKSSNDSALVNGSQSNPRTLVSITCDGEPGKMSPTKAGAMSPKAAGGAVGGLANGTRKLTSVVLMNLGGGPKVGAEGHTIGHSSQPTSPLSPGADGDSMCAPDGTHLHNAMPSVSAGIEDLAARGRQQLSSSPSPFGWDPLKEVQQLALGLKEQDHQDITLLEPIGKGGFGVVYRGLWRNLEVAVKTVLFSDKGGSYMRTGSQQRALMEAAVCTSVVHPNVITTYHYDIKPHQASLVRMWERGSTYSDQSSGATATSSTTMKWELMLVQEFCQASLHDALKSSLIHDPTTRHPNIDVVLEVLLHIASGMQYLHNKNIIHGDLKPENVLLKYDQNCFIGVRAIITDFGLCINLPSGASAVSNARNGTPFYVAPEIVRSAQATKASDVYSFGVVMWEMYRCRPPWVRTRTGYGPSPHFCRFPKGTPKPYFNLCARCLSSEWGARPTFREIINMLREMQRLRVEAQVKDSQQQQTGMDGLLRQHSQHHNHTHQPQPAQPLQGHQQQHPPQQAPQQQGGPSPAQSQANQGQRVSNSQLNSVSNSHPSQQQSSGSGTNLSCPPTPPGTAASLPQAAAADTPGHGSSVPVPGREPASLDAGSGAPAAASPFASARSAATPPASQAPRRSSSQPDRPLQPSDSFNSTMASWLALGGVRSQPLDVECDDYALKPLSVSPSGRRLGPDGRPVGPEPLLEGDEEPHGEPSV